MDIRKYKPDGSQVVVHTAVSTVATGDGAIVSDVMIYDEDEHGPFEQPNEDDELFSPPYYTDLPLSDKPAMKLFHENVRETEQRYEKAHAKYMDVQSQLAEANNKLQKLNRKLDACDDLMVEVSKKHESLELISAYMDGNISHIVVINQYDNIPRIVAADSREANFREDNHGNECSRYMYLLTLVGYGDRSNPPRWTFNGTRENAFLFTSEDAAKEKAASIALQMQLDHKRHGYEQIAKACKLHDVPFSDEFQVIYDMHVSNNKSKKIRNAKDSIKKATDELEALEAE